MRGIRSSSLKKRFHQGLRRLLAGLPTDLRFRLYRRLIDCDPEPDIRLELKIAETQEELEACFRILHDAYVGSGFMTPHPSGMRVTQYHALPTTTTLCAKFDGKVVGTISMVRDGVFGFPMQSIFDLSEVRAKQGNIAEISALAVHHDFRRTGGAILFPLMKFMYEYCTAFFDTRHLVIAVNPDKIEMYESLLFFNRLNENTVDKYDFANGAPAVGATLDLEVAQEQFRRVYAKRSERKNLYRYFVGVRMPNIKLPRRRYNTTNDPVLTPQTLDYFFNQKSDVFSHLNDRHKALLWSIYDTVDYRSLLPMLSGTAAAQHPMRRHRRFSLRCPAELKLTSTDAKAERRIVMTVIEISLFGFQALSQLELPPTTDEVTLEGEAIIDLGVKQGLKEQSFLKIQLIRRHSTADGCFYGFKVHESDQNWRNCVSALETGLTVHDL